MVVDPEISELVSETLTVLQKTVVQQSAMGKRIIELAVQIRVISDEALARAGDIAQLAEDYEDEHGEH